MIKKFVIYLCLLSTVILTAGCATNISYCDLDPKILPSVEDQLTEGTKRQINSLNLKYEAFCGKIK